MTPIRILPHVGMLLAGLILSAAPAAAGDTLVIYGKTVSTDVRSLDGSAYVNLADVAKALGMTLVKGPGGYELTKGPGGSKVSDVAAVLGALLAKHPRGEEIQKAGGANQVQGVAQGKIGDQLFDGRWRFQVLSLETPEAYTMKVPSVEPSSYPADLLEFDRTTHVVRPKAGYKLVVLQCRMANGQKSTQAFWLARKDVNTALADTQAESHPPVAYDLEGAPAQSQPLLPGAKAEFAVLFIIPRAAQVKDLVFTLKNNDSSQKGNDVRVSLLSGG